MATKTAPGFDDRGQPVDLLVDEAEPVGYGVLRSRVGDRALHEGRPIGTAARASVHTADGRLSQITRRRKVIGTEVVATFLTGSRASLRSAARLRVSSLRCCPLRRTGRQVGLAAVPPSP